MIWSPQVFFSQQKQQWELNIQDCDGNEQLVHRLPRLVGGHRPSSADQHRSHVLRTLHCHPRSRWRLQCESFTNFYWGDIFFLGGAGKFGVWQLPRDIKQAKEKPFEQQRTEPGEVPVLQQPDQSWPGWKLQGVKSFFFPQLYFAWYNMRLCIVVWWWVELRERSEIGLLGLRELCNKLYCTTVQ